MKKPVKLADLLGNAIPTAMDTKNDWEFLTDCADSRYLRAHLPESEMLAFHRWQQSRRRAVDFPWSDEALALIDFELGVLVRLRDLMAEAKSAITSPALLAEAERMRKGKEGTATFGQVKEIHARMMRGGVFEAPAPTELQAAEEGLAEFPDGVEESQAAMMRYTRAIAATSPLLGNPETPQMTAEEAMSVFREMGRQVAEANREITPDFPESVEDSQMAMLNSLRAQGLMSVEQYKQAVRDIKGDE